MKITVYCGANNSTNPKHQETTIQLAKWIAENHHTLVYGGAKKGLMGIIADTVLQHGGQVIGVIPRFLKTKEKAHTGLTEMLTVENMPARKMKMFELGEAYIALPGGLGTLEEISEMVSWARIGQNPNPCIFYNADNYYTPLKHFFDDMVNTGFLSQADRDLVLFSADLTEIQDFIDHYQPPEFHPE
ncbi:TIGR00730 family Rossman fold protein [Mannheimia massilioguelmaensis]|uniref:LOG family protein n=1 Tax=Mannheimia massilioguelmaensis TaxID=1604354 RepID=UPI0005C99616|nr:TIGR00730 family Rossman fold protein [Mannheimia massilioguelmaensis]